MGLNSDVNDFDSISFKSLWKSSKKPQWKFMYRKTFKSYPADGAKVASPKSSSL